MLNRSTGWHRTGNPFRGALAGSSGVRRALQLRRLVITSRLGGPGRQTPAGAAPEGLRHPDPLNKGGGRGVLRQHKHPVEGPATGKVGGPTAGCGVCACGYGYPEHVATSCLEGVSGRPKNLHHKVRWPEWPLPVAKPVDGATPLWTYVERHPTALARSDLRFRVTCRAPPLPGRRRLGAHPPHPARRPDMGHFLTAPAPLCMGCQLPVRGGGTSGRVSAAEDP